MSVRDEIFNKLMDSLQPIQLEITDQSELHKGHSGWREEGETHFRVLIVSSKFTDLSRLERHRIVHSVLSKQLLNNIHALSLDLRDK